MTERRPLISYLGGPQLASVPEHPTGLYETCLLIRAEQLIYSWTEGALLHRVKIQCNRPILRSTLISDSV